MKLFKWAKDGGPKSYVNGLFVVEIKSLFSIVILHFSAGSRPAYHSHAFNAWSWLIRGKLDEYVLNTAVNFYRPSFIPIWTSRGTFHKVVSVGDSWAITFRGPWSKTWREFTEDQTFITLTDGRKVV